MPVAFFSAVDHLGSHSYFHTLSDAEAFQRSRGGYIIMTTTNRIWRVTLPCRTL